MPVSFQQKIRFKPQPEERIDEFQFVGGLKTDAHETKLENNQSPDMANVVFNATGSIKTRGGYLRYNGDPVGISSDTSNTGASTSSLALTNSTDYVAQTFIPSGAIEVLQVDLYLGMQTSGQEQYVRAELWETSAGLPSSLVTDGKGQIKLISGTSETKYSFRFRQPVALSAATTYAIITKPFVRGTVQTIRQVNVYHRGATYANGSVITSSNSGLDWTADTAKDLRFNVFSGGTTAPTGLTRYYGPNAIRQLITKVGATLYRGDDTTGAMTAITLPSGVTLNADNFIDWTISNDTLLVVDRENRIKKYRGSTNTNYSTGTITTTSGSTSIVGSGSTWNTSTNVEVGEYIQLPDSKWYKITAVSSDTALTIERAYLGGSSSAQNYIISPWGEVQGKLGSSSAVALLVRPTPNYIENHINRVWTLEGNTLRFSALDTSITEENFNDFDTSNNAGSIIIPGGRGDTCTGLYSLNGYLYVFQKNAIWEIFGTSPSNFELRNISNEIGMTDKRTLVEYDRYLCFLSEKGGYKFDGANLINLTDGVINTLIATWANKTSPAAVLWKNHYILSYTIGGELGNTEAIFFDLTRNIWGKVEGASAGLWSSWVGAGDEGEIYFASSNQGSIYQWDVGGHDDGYEIETRYDTPSLGFGKGINDKAIKKFYIQQVALGDWDMTVTELADINALETEGEAINLSGGGSLWGVAIWGVDLWSAEGSLITTRIAEFQGIAKFFKFRFYQFGYAEGLEILQMTATARLRRLQ